MSPVVVAQLFHEAYERLAPEHGYKTREASAVPWDDVPEDNRALMVATAEAVIDQVYGAVAPRIAAQCRQSPAAIVQPRPRHIEGAPSVHDLLVQDILDRKLLGEERYGTILQAGDTGRNTLWDALQEALDLAAYLRKLIEEWDQQQARIAELEERNRALELERAAHLGRSA